MRSHGTARGGQEKSERGTALVTTIFVSFLLGLLGFSYVVMGDLEARTVERHLDRERCRAAAWDVAQLAASWWSLGPRDSAWMPQPGEWKGPHVEWREQGLGHPFWNGLDPEDLTGDELTPDLVLDDGPFLVDLAATLGENLVVERLSISSAPVVEGRRQGLATLSCTVVARRRGLFGGRARLVARVRSVPAFAGPEVVAAGGDVRLAPGARVRWGRLRADGAVRVPGENQDGFPASGLPRNASGGLPLGSLPGGTEDWDPSTSFRESLLSELIGYTRGGQRVVDGESAPPFLADPWLAVEAGSVLRVGAPGRGWTRGRSARQPRPHEPLETELEAGRSHFLHHLGGGTHPLLEGRLEDLAGGRTGPPSGQQRSLRRFASAGERGDGEGLWREGGSGPPHTAAEWLRGSERAPMVAVFTAAGGEPPRRVTLNESAGMVLVEARRLILETTGGGRLEAVNMPGEPFLDRGIDTDGDGRAEPGTAGNGRWDCDCDGDGLPDGEAPRELLFELVHADVRDGAFPDEDRDPSSLGTAPHEPFLNLAWPQGPGDLAVRVAYGDLPGVEERPVEDLDGDGVLRRGADRFTSKARDARGARVDLTIHFRGLVANLAGSVELRPGYAVHGAVRAAGDVELLAGASVSFDDNLAVEGRPAKLGLPVAFLGERSFSSGAPRARAVAGPSGPSDPPAPTAGLGGAGPGASRGNSG